MEATCFRALVSARCPPPLLRTLLVAQTEPDVMWEGTHQGAAVRRQGSWGATWRLAATGDKQQVTARREVPSEAAAASPLMSPLSPRAFPVYLGILHGPCR